MATSIHSFDIKPVFTTSRSSLYAFINITANFRDSLDLMGNKDPKGPKEIK